MAETVTMNASWGVSASASVEGIVTDLSLSEEAIHQPLQNETGAVVGSTQYDTRKTATATIQVKAATELPTAGSEITIAGAKYCCTRAEKVYSNKDYVKIRVDAEAYTNWAGATTAP